MDLARVLDLSGRVALVTGASRGLGRAIAVALARAGADVAVNFLQSAERAAEVVRSVEETGRRALAVKADVSDLADAASLVERTAEEFGRLDVLVNNAGITRDGLLLRLKEEDWDQVLATNLKSLFNCTKAASRIMLKQRRGRIINISSVIGLLGNAGQTNYAAAKAGIIGFTKAAARELGSRGITVNAVAPGFIMSEMTEHLPEAMKSDYLGRIPLGRFGDPEDVAKAVLFLASDGAAYITGVTLTVDGGLVMP